MGLDGGKGKCGVCAKRTSDHVCKFTERCGVQQQMLPAAKQPLGPVPGVSSQRVHTCNTDESDSCGGLWVAVPNTSTFRSTCVIGDMLPRQTHLHRCCVTLQVSKHHVRCKG